MLEKKARICKREEANALVEEVNKEEVNKELVNKELVNKVERVWRMLLRAGRRCWDQSTK